MAYKTEKERRFFPIDRGDVPLVMVPPGECPVTVIGAEGREDVVFLALEAGDATLPVLVLPPEGDEINPRPPGQPRTKFTKVKE